ncbi:MAG: hypothetical protein WCG98_06175 [bacterium]
MKKYVAKKTWIIKLFLMVCSLFGLYLAFGTINAGIPNEYVANYEINTDRNQIL